MRERFISVLGCRTRYFDEGQGETVVLLHGGDLAGDCVSAWSPIYADLCKSFRVVAFDQVGFGETAAPKGVEYVNRLDRVPHAIAFLELLGIRRAALIGHSEGGFVAVRIAIERPSLPTKLVIITSSSVAPRLGGAADDEWMAAATLAYDYASGAGSEDDLVTMYKVLSRENHPALEAHVRESYRRAMATTRLDAFRVAAAPMTDFDDYMSVQERWIQPHLSTISLPTLLLWAADDATVGVERGVRLMQLMPRADLCVLRDAAHMVIWDRTAAVRTLLQGWLRNATAAAADATADGGTST